MKIKMIRRLSLILAVALMLGCVGCSGSSSKKNNSKVVNNCYESGLPIAEETVTFTVMVKDDGVTMDYEDLPINDWLLENMNVKIEWLPVTGGQENQQATLAFTSGNMPDILMGMAPLGYEFYWDYVLEGKIIDLAPYVKEYGKNIIKMFNDYPLAEYLCTGYDGGLYMLPEVRSYENDKGRFAGKIYINQKWLDNLGLETPTTTKEFKAVLEAFRDNDPNGNGIADEIPMDLGRDLPVGLYGPFGLSLYHHYFYMDENEQMHFAPIEDDYRRALTYYRDLYQEDLIGPDFMNQDMKDIAEKINGSVTTVGCFVNDGISLISDERIEEYVVLAPLSDEYGNCTWTNQQWESMYQEWFIVTSECKYPEVAVRLADYFYSTEGSLISYYGPPGKDMLWDYNEDGKAVFTNYADKESLKREYTPGYPMPHYMSEEFYDIQYVEQDESKLTLREQITRRNLSYQIETYSKVVPEKALPIVKRSLENMKRYNAIKSKLTHSQWRTKFLNGTASLENEWDTYIEDMKRAGVDEWIKIQQESYDEYKQWLNQ